MYQILTKWFYKHRVFAPSDPQHSKGTVSSDRWELRVTERLAQGPRVTQPESHSQDEVRLPPMLQVLSPTVCFEARVV